MKKQSNELSNHTERKFVESIELSDWEVFTDTGWEDVTHFNKTVEYDVWEITTDCGTVIRGADTHIFIDVNGNEVFLKDSLGVELKSENGIETVILVTDLEYMDNMYDLSVDSENHTYYTNGILSHNTTMAAAYLLWFAMFNDNVTILLTSNKWEGAQEILHKVKIAYESTPDHIKAGVVDYNKRSIIFDNRSRILGTTTTETTGRRYGIIINLY